MTTEILKSFGSLQSELEQARNSLRGVDENIKRLIGRDPSEITQRAGVKRGPQAEEIRGRQRLKNINHENDEPANKRRNMSVFKRLSERPSHYEDDFSQQPHKQMISKVIVTSREIPSRQEALAAQNSDEKSKARNRRMFGALLGTLQKFQQEETKLKQKEEKRAQVEKKIEEHEIKEKAEIRKEKQELFLNRKKKQAEIRMIELKIMRMKELAFWEERQKPKMNFIMTKAKPQICYLPRKLNETNQTALESCRAEIEKSIDQKRQEVFDELQHIEDRMKKNFESRKSKEEKQEKVSENGETIVNDANEETKEHDVNTQSECNGKIEDENLKKEECNETENETIKMEDSSCNVAMEVCEENTTENAEKQTESGCVQDEKTENE